MECVRVCGCAQATGQRIGTVLQAAGTFGFALALALVYEWRVGLVALAFVPLMAAVLYKEGRLVSAESFGTAKTMEASSKVRLLTSLVALSGTHSHTFWSKWSGAGLPILISKSDNINNHKRIPIRFN
jgi:hypothetical protein